VELISRWSLTALVGLHVEVGGGRAGLCDHDGRCHRWTRRSPRRSAVTCGSGPGRYLWNRGSRVGGLGQAAGWRHDSRHRPCVAWISSRAHALWPFDG
jgi:hypothetical protein